MTHACGADTCGNIDYSTDAPPASKVDLGPLPVAELDPCGECPKGTCDNCSGCRWIAAIDARDA